jgi:hypothetical protein
MVENNYIVQASLQVFTQNATTAATGVPTKATTAATAWSAINRSNQIFQFAAVVVTIIYRPILTGNFK